MSAPLEVAVLWHMHQPDYRDKLKGRAVLPWVRLHAVKDYYPMAALVDEFPGLRVTFNYVPSLLDQLEDYLAGRSLDEHLVLSTVAARDLNQEGQIFLLRNFFMANHETMIRPFPRYLELLEKRGPSGEQRHLESAQRVYGAKDFLDLQVLFNLAWFGPYFLKTDPLCRELAAKGQGFTEAEKGALLERQREIAGQVVPLLRRLVAEGRIEISTTPFYHPILPLLVDSDCARVAMPDVTLPHQAFRHPEDALAQIRKAIAFHERAFGERPQGIWPSEGSVSPAVLQLFQEQGLRWTATDENILFRSLGLPLNQEFYRSGKREELLYQPYRTETGTTAVFFRDHVLSDLVGFSYSRWDAARRRRRFHAPAQGDRRDSRGAAGGARRPRHPRRRERLGVLPRRRPRLHPRPLPAPHRGPRAAQHDLSRLSRPAPRRVEDARDLHRFLDQQQLRDLDRSPRGQSGLGPALRGPRGAGARRRRRKPCRPTVSPGPGKSCTWPRAATGAGGTGTTTPRATTRSSTSSTGAT